MRIRTLKTTDLDRVAKIEQIAWGVNAASARMIASRAATFEPGSIVAVHKGEIVGYAAAQLTDHISTETWDQQTDGGNIAGSHRPGGRLAYGVSMSAVPRLSGQSVARAVIDHYARVFLGGGCDLLCVGSRVPGYSRWSATRTGECGIEEYLKYRPRDRAGDPEVRLYESHGFRCSGPCVATSPTVPAADTAQ